MGAVRRGAEEVVRYLGALRLAALALLVGWMATVLGWVISPGSKGLFVLALLLVTASGFGVWRRQEREKADLRSQLAESEAMRASLGHDRRAMHVLGHWMPLLRQPQMALERVSRPMRGQPDPTEAQVAAASRQWRESLQEALVDIDKCGPRVRERVHGAMFGPVPTRNPDWAPAEADAVLVALVELHDEAVKNLAAA